MAKKSYSNKEELITAYLSGQSSEGYAASLSFQDEYLYTGERQDNIKIAKIIKLPRRSDYSPPTFQGGSVTATSKRYSSTSDDQVKYLGRCLNTVHFAPDVDASPESNLEEYSYKFQFQAEKLVGMTPIYGSWVSSSKYREDLSNAQGYANHYDIRRQIDVKEEDGWTIYPSTGVGNNTAIWELEDGGRSQWASGMGPSVFTHPDGSFRILLTDLQNLPVLKKVKFPSLEAAKAALKLSK